MNALPKSIRFGLSALLLCALSLLGTARVRGLASLHGGGFALVHKSEGGADAQLLYAGHTIADAAMPEAPGLYKGKPEGCAKAFASSHSGLPPAAWRLQRSAYTAIRKASRSRLSAFTPVQRLMLYPHHGFW